MTVFRLAARGRARTRRLCIEAAGHGPLRRHRLLGARLRGRDRQRLPRPGARSAHASSTTRLLTAIQSWVGFDFSRDELDDALYRLMRSPEWIDPFDGTRAALARAEEPHLPTSSAASRAPRPTATREAYALAVLTRYRAMWSFRARSSRPRWRCSRASSAPSSSRSKAARAVYRQQRARARPARVGCSRPARGLDAMLRRRLRERPATDAARKRVIVDQVASLTDQHAIAWHGRLVGEVDAASLGVWAPRRSAAAATRGDPAPRPPDGGPHPAGRRRRGEGAHQHRRHHRRARGAEDRRRRRA